MSFVKEFLAFLRMRKKFWLVPLMMIFAIVGMLFAFSQGSAVAPFIYTLF